MDLANQVGASLALARREAPLMFAQLWHEEHPKTSQRDSITALMTPKKLFGFLLGGHRCLSGDTPVDLWGGGTIPIGEVRGPIEIAAWDGNGFRPAWAEAHQRKGPDRLYRVTLSDGSWFEATAWHRVLSASGIWTSVRELRPGSALVRPPTTLDNARPARGEGDLRWSRTVPGSRSDCPSSLRSDDERPPFDRGGDRGASPSRDGAQGCTHPYASQRVPSAFAHVGGLQSTPSRSRPDLSSAHLSSRYDQDRLEDHFAGPEYRVFDTAGSRAGSCSQFVAPPHHASTLRPRSNVADRQSATISRRVLPAWTTSVVISVSPVRIDHHFDLWVPGFESYSAAGAVHHNSGKSQGMGQLAVALGLGREHPWVRLWCMVNEIDPELIPSGPGTVWIVSGDSNDSRRIARPKVAAYLGTSARWRNKDGNGEAEAIIETDDGLAKWVFKSVDQGRDGFQGDAVRAILFDEEPLDYEVVEESMFRVVDQAGRLLFFMTPVYGWTKLLHERIREVRPDTVVRYIHGEDNPHVDQTALRMSLAATSSHLIDARAYGRVTSAEGLVYAFDRNVHVIRSFDPPRDWPRYLVIDFGVRNPAAWMYAAHDLKDDTLHWYREHYKAGMTVRQHWEENKEHIRSIRLKKAIADPEDLNARMELEALGLKTLEADKDIRGGIDAVSSRLARDAAGKVHMFVHDCCVNMIREHEGYRWPKQRPGAVSDPKEVPVAKDNHTCDTNRYLCKHLHRRENPLAKLKRRFPSGLVA